jgi:hypothetical protein
MQTQRGLKRHPSHEGLGLASLACLQKLAPAEHGPGSWWLKGADAHATKLASFAASVQAAHWIHAGYTLDTRWIHTGYTLDTPWGTPWAHAIHQ